MRTLFRMAPLAIAIAATPTLAQDGDTARLEQQINNLQQQVNNLSDDRIRFNGFFSTGYARASNDAGYAGNDESSDIYDQSLMALQASFDITDKTQAVMQIISRGAEDWNTSMEWAYLSYRPTNALQLRAGKMRRPFYMYSDSLEVGYAQPWARAPQVVYGSSLSSYMGTDASYTFNLDNSSITSQFFYGHIEEGGSGIALDLRNSGGMSLAWTDYVWTVRGVVSKSELTLTIPYLPAIEEEDALYLGAGISYDDGSWQIISEATRIEVDGYFADTDAAYLSVGHRFGAFTPYTVVGMIKSKDNSERVPMLAPAFNNNRKDYSLGVRWDATPGIALKADWTHSTGLQNGSAGLNYQTVVAEDLDNTNVYTIKLDAAF